MFAHIAKLIWQRKRANTLIIIEIVISFFVLFFILSSAIAHYKTFTMPLGFEWQNRWQLSIDTGASWQADKDIEQLKQLVMTLRQQPEISTANVFQMPVFRNSTWSRSTTVNDMVMSYHANTVDDTGLANSQVELLQGRWFGPQDRGQHYRPILVNQRFVDTYLPTTDPIEFQISGSKPEIPPYKIVGVYKDYRQQGDFAKSVPYVFNRYDYDVGTDNGVHHIQLSFEQKQTIAYEERLQHLLKTIAPTWRFKIAPLETLRKQAINDVVIPMTILSVVVVFLLLMVAMGLFGVLWQDISRRTQEIGLRRALGASEWAIQAQIIGEVVVLGLFSIVLAFVFLVQVPLLQLLDFITWEVFMMSMLASSFIILLLITMCALYPSRTAFNIPPSVALHYE